ncbi:helix-turn-helix domain-containing protein [Alicyclobacillus fodiniaquatilis]|jgi:transcriptional regulator with XRE-family HTH domain|uniref:Helix-turn-helix domain-containing protein n=1 Tax=Alicyclobacillus fodiniaquatilis TaxID=1661150 RepID=A0ABW4JIE4_9BACL
MTGAERELLSLVIGHRVREKRKKYNLSQNDLANGVGSQSMISLIESGRQLPLPDILRVLAERLNDPVLQHYAEHLENNTLTDFDVSEHNQDDLLDILLNHKGRWHPAHERIASQLCHHYYYTRNFEKAEKLCKIVILHVQSAVIKAETYYYLGSCLLQQMKFEEAETWLRKSEALADELTEPFKGKLYYNLSYTYTYLDIQVLALWYASQSVDTFHRLNDFPKQGKALGLLGVIQTRLGRVEEAKQSLVTSYDIVSRWGFFDKGDQSRILITLAETCSLLGQQDEAYQYAQEAMKSMDESDHLGNADIYRLHGLFALKNDDIKTALDFVLKGLEAARAVNEPHSLTQLYLLYIEMTDDIHEKIQAARNAFELTANTNYHILHALAAECLANLIARSPEPKEDAAQYTQAALDAYRTYVHKNSMFTHLIENLPVYDSYSEETPDIKEDDV